MGNKLYLFTILLLVLFALVSCGKGREGDVTSGSGAETGSASGYVTGETDSPYAPAGGASFKDRPTYVTASPIGKMPLTMEAWVRFDPESEGNSVLFGNMSKIKTNSFCLRLRDGIPTLVLASRAESVIFPKATLEGGAWTHLAVVSDIEGKRFLCYINGVLKETRSMIEGHIKAIESVEFNEDTDTHMTMLGGIFSWASQVKESLCGELGFFAAYSDARSAEEIAADYKSFKNPDKNELMLAYIFDGDNKAVYRDLSGNENDLSWMGYGYVEKDELKLPSNYDYSMMVVGDTQGLTGRNDTAGYYGLYDWIAENIDSKKIEAVIGVGDITNSNIASQWEKAVVAFEKLKGKVRHFPVLGNHDVSVSYGGDDAELYKKYLPLDDSADGDSMDGSVKAYYRRFTVKGIKYLFLGMSYEPKQAEVDFAKTVLEAHPDYNVILSCHGYLDADGSLLSHSGGPILREQLVLPYSNIVLVLCGHMHSDNVLLYTEDRDDGTVVQAVLTNPQEYNYDVNIGVVTGLYFTNGGKTVYVANHLAGHDSYLGADSVRRFELDPVHLRRK